MGSSLASALLWGLTALLLLMPRALGLAAAMLQGRHREHGGRAQIVASAALEAVGLLDRAAHRPNQLSGGQCQRVGIARALVGRPRLLLADEPTGALASVSGELVVELMLSLHRSYRMTLIVVTHDANLARRLPRCIRLVDGRVYSDVRQGVLDD